MKSVMSIYVIKIETKRMMNMQLIVYKIAQIIQMTDKTSKNEVKMIVWELISFLIDEYENFLIDEMMNHCRNFLKFLKMMIEIFPEFLIEMKMKVIAWENFSLLMTCEVIVSLMLDEMLFLLLIDLEVMILEI
jgi:hypothetical protein